MAYTFHSSGHILQIITITPKLWPKQRAYESLHFSFACLCSTDRSRTLIRSSLSPHLFIHKCLLWYKNMTRNRNNVWSCAGLVGNFSLLEKGRFLDLFLFFLKKGNLKNVYMREVQMGGDRWHSTRDYNKKKKTAVCFQSTVSGSTKEQQH